MKKNCIFDRCFEFGGLLSVKNPSHIQPLFSGCPSCKAIPQTHPQIGPRNLPWFWGFLSVWCRSQDFLHVARPSRIPIRCKGCVFSLIFFVKFPSTPPKLPVIFALIKASAVQPWSCNELRSCCHSLPMSQINMAASSSNEPLLAPLHEPGGEDHGEARATKAASGEANVVATPIPYEGNVHLDVVEGQAFITHIITGESVKLPPGQWSLHFEGADGALVNSAANHDVLLLEDAFTKDAYKSGTETFVRAGKAPAINTWSLDVAKPRYQSGDVSVAMLGGSTASILIYIFHLPRKASQKVFWGLKALYHILGLTSYEGVPSKWLHEAVPSWNRYIGSIAGHCATVLSKHGNLSDQRLKMPFSERCLPETCLSTLGFLLVLHRGVAFTREHGGFRDDVSKASAKALLEALLKFSFHGALSTVVLRLVPDWQSRFPRPEIEATTCSITVSSGKVDLSALVAFTLHGQTHNVAASWMKAFGKMVNVPPHK